MQKIEKMPSFKGDVLVCEDNAMNLQFIKDLLVTAGLSVSTATNGKEGVESVSRRAANGQNPYDLILMDIYMPVMGGLDAADALSKIGCRTPVVAMTSSISDEDKREYKAHGLVDCLSKPFTTKEVYGCLGKYFKAVAEEAVDSAELAGQEQKRLDRLRRNFYKSSQNTIAELNDALNQNDIKTAHRIAHTLSGLAGLLGKTLLQKIARAIERSLESGSAEDIEEQLSVLEHELNKTLKELAPLLELSNDEAAPGEVLDKNKALKLLDKLEPMLLQDSAKCVTFTGELAGVVGAGELAELINEYEFDKALPVLRALRQSILDTHQ